jgi:hypothetical protein
MYEYLISCERTTGRNYNFTVIACNDMEAITKGKYYLQKFDDGIIDSTIIIWKRQA